MKALVVETFCTLYVCTAILQCSIIFVLKEDIIGASLHIHILKLHVHKVHSQTNTIQVSCVLLKLSFATFSGILKLLHGLVCNCFNLRAQHLITEITMELTTLKGTPLNKGHFLVTCTCIITSVRSS